MFRYQEFQPIRQAWRNRSGPSLPARSQEDAIDAARQDPGEVRLAHAERQLADVLAVADQDVERIELHFIIVPARVLAVEIRPAVGAEQYTPSITKEVLRLRSAGPGDQWEAIAPVVAIPGP